jgi:hypothetical protein
MVGLAALAGIAYGIVLNFHDIRRYVAITRM